jgi:DNA-directed RNA polymerase specialized sigma24 family protein
MSAQINRPFTGHAKPKPSEPHFSELQLIIMEKLFAAPAREAQFGGITVTVRGLTAKQLAALLGLPKNTVGPRLSELRAKGAVRVGLAHAIVNKRREALWEAAL